MLREQGELLKLIDEIDIICDQLRIRYYLAGHLLQNAMKNSRIHGYSATIAMTWADFQVFRDYVNRKMSGKRMIEGIDSNHKIPKLSFRYINKNSLLLDLDYIKNSENPGIFVDIILFQNRGKKGRLISLMNYARGNNKNYASSKLKKLIKIGVRGGFNLVYRLAPEFYMNKLVKAYIDNAWNADSDQAPMIISKQSRMIGIAKNFDKKKTFANVEGHQYQTFADPEKYLLLQYGEKWRKGASCRKETYMVSTNPHVPYELFLKDSYLDNIDDSFLQERDAWLAGRTDFFKNYDPKEKKGWVHLFAAEARINCWKKYMPRKQELLQLWEEGRHDEVILILREYIECVDKYRKKKIAICFDPDIWAMYMQWLDENGDGALKAKLEAMVWPEHLKTIDTPETRRWLEQQA